MAKPPIGRRQRALLLALSLLLTGPAHGEEKLDAIEVLGHYDNAVGTSDAASQGAVTAALIKSRPVSRPAEVLEFVPGVIVTQHSGEGKANQYFLRGFNLDHGTDFATTVGGVPVNLPTHAHGQGYSDLNFLLPELIARIDYRKGPYFASVGDFASAGSADIKLHDRLPRGQTELTLGQFGHQRLFVADSRPLAGWQLLCALEGVHNRGPWRNDSNFRKANGVIRLSAQDAAQHFALTAMAYRGRWNATDQIPERALGSGLDRFDTVDPSDGGHSGRFSAATEYTRRFADGSLSVTAYAVRYRLNLYSNFSYFLDRPDTGDQFEQADRRTVWGGQLARSWNHTLGERDSQTRIGIQLRQDRIGQVGLYATAQRQRLDTTREDAVTETAVGAFVENTTQWSERLRTVTGARYDHYRFKVRADRAENAGQRQAQRVSPKLSAIFGPWAKTEFFLNGGVGFHSNDARGTTITIDPQTGEAAERVTPLVRTVGYEVGLRSEAIPGLQSSLALWRLHLDSELVFVGDAGSTEASRRSRREGIEWSNHYRLADWLVADADLSLSRARFTDGDPAGDRVPGAVERVAGLGLTLKGRAGWSGSVFLRHFGPRALTEDNRQRSKSTTLTNLALHYAPDLRWKVSASVFNLFNRRDSDIDYYYTSRLPGEPAEGVADRHFHPVLPRLAQVSLQLTF